MTIAEMLISISRVAALALAFGVGIPFLFSLGIKLQGHRNSSTAAKAAGTAVFAVLGIVIVVAVLWIARETIFHYTGFEVFPGMTGKAH